MNNQYLQFVREQLIIATADLSGATKGQLEAWQENARYVFTAYAMAILKLQFWHITGWLEFAERE